MNKAADRKKLRREYLRKKRKALLMTTVVTIGTIPAIVLVVCLGLVGLALMIKQQWLSGAALIIATFYLVKVLNFISKLSADVNYEASGLTPVPPVTPDSLPATEILVRGSEAPTLQSETLLRPATGQETPKEELLKVVAE